MLKNIYIYICIVVYLCVNTFLFILLNITSINFSLVCKKVILIQLIYTLCEQLRSIKSSNNDLGTTNIFCGGFHSFSLSPNQTSASFPAPNTRVFSVSWHGYFATETMSSSAELQRASQALWTLQNEDTNAQVLVALPRRNEEWNTHGRLNVSRELVSRVLSIIMIWRAL